MNWEIFENEQKEICERNDLAWVSVNPNSMVAINDSLFTTSQPINGLRHPKEGNIEGWYMWSGEDIPQDRDDFFHPIHIYHLINQRPQILKYLGLPIGYRFQIDDFGYEDIWYDSSVEFI